MVGDGEGGTILDVSSKDTEACALWLTLCVELEHGGIGILRGTFRGGLESWRSNMIFFLSKG